MLLYIVNNFPFALIFRRVVHGSSSPLVLLLYLLLSMLLMMLLLLLSYWIEMDVFVLFCRSSAAFSVFMVSHYDRIERQAYLVVVVVVVEVRRFFYRINHPSRSIT